MPWRQEERHRPTQKRGVKWVLPLRPSGLRTANIFYQTSTLQTLKWQTPGAKLLGCVHCTEAIGEHCPLCGLPKSQTELSLHFQLPSTLLSHPSHTMCVLWTYFFCFLFIWLSYKNGFYCDIFTYIYDYLLLCDYIFQCYSLVIEQWKRNNDKKHLKS